VRAADEEVRRVFTAIAASFYGELRLAPEHVISLLSYIHYADNQVGTCVPSCPRSHVKSDLEIASAARSGRSVLCGS
jgi:hypothetical protein